MMMGGGEKVSGFHYHQHLSTQLRTPPFSHGSSTTAICDPLSYRVHLAPLRTLISTPYPPPYRRLQSLPPPPDLPATSRPSRYL